MRNLRCIVVDDIRIARMLRGIVLVISLSRIKSLQRDHLGNNGAGKDFGFVELCNVCLSDPFLLVVGIPDRRAVLRAFVWTLTVQLGGVMGHGEEDAKQLGVSDL